MATPNYGFEKRQKELAKKRKKEEKLKEKAARKHSGPMPDDAEGTVDPDAQDNGAAAADPAAPRGDATAS